MKKIRLMICVLLVSATVAHAQADRYSVEAADIELIRTGEYVTVTFTFHAGQKATRGNYNLVVNPVIRQGGNQVQLPSIVIQGRRAKVSAERHELATGQRTYQRQPVYMPVGGTIDYGATIPYESWMTGAQLLLNGVSVGCCSSTETHIGLVADNILYTEPQTDIQIFEVPVEIPSLSTGDMLAQQYSFVVPASELERKTDGFDYNMALNLGKGLTTANQGEVERFINDTREGSISIYFRQGDRVIDRHLGENNKNLVELISVVRALVAASDSKVARIVIAGFASPEGSVALNDRLAWDRAVAVRDFLTANSGIDPANINIYNGAADWTGLRELVSKSGMYRRDRIIDIIDHVPVWDSNRQMGRHGELMRLDGGEPYRYMLSEFFPKLRQAAYIKVYYHNE